jgi:hypothetical protein
VGKKKERDRDRDVLGREKVYWKLRMTINLKISVRV